MEDPPGAPARSSDIGRQTLATLVHRVPLLVSSTTESLASMRASVSALELNACGSALVKSSMPEDSSTLRLSDGCLRPCLASHNTEDDHLRA